MSDNIVSQSHPAPLQRQPLSADQWRVADRFDTSYYNGLDVRVMLGDYVIADVVGLSYELLEQATPVYGYASYTFQRVIRGNRIIRGQFTINFKQSGYIVWMVNRYYESLGHGLTAGARYRHALSQLSAGESNLPALRGDILRTVATAVTTGSSEEVRLLARHLKMHFWGVGDDEQRLQAGYTPMFRQGVVPLRLFIAYGDPQLKDSRGVLLQKPVEPAAVAARAAINATVSDSAELFQAEELIDVHILGYNKAIDDSGRNLLEQYQFIARDIIFWQSPAAP